MKTNPTPLLIAAGLILFASCAKDNVTAPAANITTKCLNERFCSESIHGILDERFTLTWLNGYAVQAAPGTEQPWMRMAAAGGGTLQGHTGCAHLVGNVEIDNANLHFNELSVPQNFCVDNGQLAQEFRAALDEIDKYVFNGTELRLVRGHTILMKLMKDRPATSVQQDD